jgi:hypothetical protein
VLYPAHGPPIDDPKPFVQSFIEHRLERERQILQCLAEGISVIADMVPRMYQDVPAFLHPAAARSVFAQVLHLLEREVITCDGEPLLSTSYRLK